MKMQVNISKAIELYSKYNTEVLNDPKYGEELMEKARIILNNQQFKKDNLDEPNEQANLDLSNDSNPIIVVSTEQDKFGIIINLNVLAA